MKLDLLLWIRGGVLKFAGASNDAHPIFARTVLLLASASMQGQCQFWNEESDPLFLGRSALKP